MDMRMLQGVGADWSRIATEGAGAAKGAQATDGGNAFARALQELSDYQAEADTAVDRLIAGEDVALHEVMIAAERADIAFRVALQLRNKLVRAYEDVMRMQI